MQTLTTDHFLVDNSSIELMTTCPWLAYAKIIRQRVPAGDSPALRFGGHIHAALAYKYRRMAQGHVATNDMMFRILSHRFAATPCEGEDWRNVNQAQAVIEAYNEQYADDNFTIPQLKGFPFVEKPFAVYAGTIGKRKIVYIGRIDLVIQDGPHIYIMDHKTTSVLGETYWKDAAVSEQQRGYCWAYRQVTGNEPLGYRMNVLACRKPSKSGKAIEFQRATHFIQEPPRQLDVWHDNMLAQAETFLWHVDRDVFPRHHKQCINKYGACAFYNVCALPEQSQEELLMSCEYKQNDWSPLYKPNEITK